VAKLCGSFARATTSTVRAGGIAEGNAAISGVQKIDAFFSAVLSFETAADGVSDASKTQLDAIKADFGITANWLRD